MLFMTSNNGSLAGSGIVRQPENRNLATHGPRSTGPLHGFKGSVYEGGHGVPFIARCPGEMVPGSTSEERLSLVDLLATAAELVGAEAPDNAAEGSFNVLPALLGQSIDRVTTIHHSGRGRSLCGRAIRRLYLGRARIGWIVRQTEGICWT